jgi:hypothetical protein
LIFAGVFLVIRSKSRDDLEKAQIEKTDK